MSRARRRPTWDVWHNEDLVRALHRRYLAGERPAALAREFGASRRGLYYAFDRLHLSNRSAYRGGKAWPDGLAREAYARYLKGERLADLARERGTSHVTLYRTLERLRLPRLCLRAGA